MNKILINSKTLLTELNKLKGMIPSNPSIPILENFLFEVSDGLLKLTASDLQTAVSIEIEIESNENFSIAVPARMLLATLSSLPNQIVTLTFEDGKLELLSDNGRYNLACEDAADFPKSAQRKNTTNIMLSSDVLANALSYTLFCTSSDEMKPAMNGVCFESKDKEFRFVATDSHRLTRVKIENVIDTHLAIIIPAKALEQVKNTLPSTICEIQLEFNDSNTFFNFQNVSIVTRLIDERFPDYENVIPANNDKFLKIDKKQLVDSLKRVSIYANKTSQQIRFKLENNNLLISAEDVDFSNEAKENLPCIYDGDVLEIGFNGKFITEMLNNLPCDTVTFEFSEPNRAALIYPTDNVDNVLMLVMPVMLNNYY